MSFYRLLDSVPELGATDAGQERVTPDLDRKKRVISRENLMKQAETILTELAHSRSLLEVQVGMTCYEHTLRCDILCIVELFFCSTRTKWAPVWVQP